MLLDAGGVIVLPDRELVRGALAGIGMVIDPSAVAPAHYAAVRALDRDAPAYDLAATYVPALCAALRVPAEGMADAVAVLAELADRRRSRQILWREPVSGALETMRALARAGLGIVVVTNSDGHGEENLRAAGICQAGPGAGAAVLAVIDSTVVGSAKPDGAIFDAALRCAGAGAHQVVHVGDRVLTDVIGAEAAGIVPIHFDPARRCRDRSHRHSRSLSGIWRHVKAYEKSHLSPR